MPTADNPPQLRTEGHPAPGRLVLVHGFLNTWSDELEIEDFESPSSTEDWLRMAGLWTANSQLSRKQHQRIVQFRDCLRGWMSSEEAFGALNASMASLAFTPEVTAEGKLVFTATGDPCDRAIGELLGVIAESASNGTWDRLKCCAMASCGWAFYDSTRSRTKRWCSMRTCGSRHKSREYYRRTRAG